MTWKYCNLIHYFEVSREEKLAKTIFLLNIESGIAWNPFGKKSPKLGEWTWCEPNNTVNFINKLVNDDFLCILHAESKDVIPVIDEMQTHFPKPLMAIIGLDIPNTINFLNAQLTKFIISPRILDKNYKYLSIPKYNNIEGIENTDIQCLTIPKNLPNDKTIIILVGQPSCGKTTYANKLQKDGFIIITENESRLIKSGLIKTINNFKQILSSDNKGVIIDADNATHMERQIFVDIGKSININVVIHWITKSGYHFNKNRNQKTSEIDLESYSYSLECPSLFDIPVIRVI
jgi:hypothetical protein